MMVIGIYPTVAASETGVEAFKLAGFREADISALFSGKVGTVEVNEERVTDEPAAGDVASGSPGNLAKRLDGKSCLGQISAVPPNNWPRYAGTEGRPQTPNGMGDSRASRITLRHGFTDAANWEMTIPQIALTRHRFTIADDEAVETLMSKLETSGGGRVNRERLWQALETAMDEYRGTDEKDRKAFFHRPSNRRTPAKGMAFAGMFPKPFVGTELAP